VAHPQADELDQPDSQDLGTEMVVREGWVQEKKRGAACILGWIFSCTYSNEKTENARRPREARELSRHTERNRGKSIWREDARESKSELAVSSPFPYGRCV